ncbi:MAG: hypothetical protein JNK49_21690, partial [Planctomycetes bacterium]|nr:hypothetical protein [Planctomycetota bacterium]
MTAFGSSYDLDKLLEERAQLAAQVELLVRTEQQLYRSQNELDVQLLRLRALARFSIDLGGEPSSDDVLVRAAHLLGEGFAIDWVGALRILPETRAVELVATHTGAHPCTATGLPAEAWQWLTTLTEAQLLTASRGAAAAGARGCVETLLGAGAVRWTTSWQIGAVPLHHAGNGCRGALLLASWRPRPVPVRDGGVAEQHLPVLQLLGQHVDHAIGAATLNRSLRERSSQLAHSLASLERAQQALVEARKMEAIGRLAGGVAHDFNNLLTVVLGCAEEILAELPSAAPLRSSARSIVEAGRRAAQITQQLLALGRRQARRPVALDLGRAAGESMAVLSRLLTSQIRLSVVADPQPAVVEVDPAQLEQVLLNLVVNARDAMPDGGQLTVRTRGAAPADLTGRAQHLDPARFAVLEVSDTGVGMDEATRTRIFEPFFTTKASKQHAGLG